MPGNAAASGIDLAQAPRAMRVGVFDREEDWRVSFAKFVTSVSGVEIGVGIAEGPQRTGDLTASADRVNLSSNGGVSSACAAHLTIALADHARWLADITVQQNLNEVLRRVAEELDHLADNVATPEADSPHPETLPERKP